MVTVVHILVCVDIEGVAGGVDSEETLRREHECERIRGAVAADVATLAQ
jgi:D-aminopeptidase